MEWSRRVEYHIFLIYRKLTVQDFNFQLFGILRVSPVRFDGSPSWYLTFYLNLSGRGVIGVLFTTFLCGHFKPFGLKLIAYLRKGRLITFKMYDH